MSGQLRSSFTALLMLAPIACSSDRPQTNNTDGGISDGIGTDDGIGDGDGDPGDGDPGDGDGDGGPKLDFSIPDVPDPQAPIIPETCEQAQAGESTVGCLFYGVDLDS
ncbi:MAG TPA: hypothetical protein VM869_00710, partial [Enhygromyxa sp.]|nr:hypothetical protein [Enhygromyxa sp.]